ncbi:MarR family winged helix-turn-helix transcriptional regulator [Paenibacillus eucommiae]|uniref:DNA-binding MarR family transcriptional regulator n=1 Tax=Paenibacillus eucommiae TaxID=1355755 RepID=A0ABS4JB49_9BACL|nr:MarR family transcriptional regulator [Paenibacillus eucommiae]MBP1997070.1 DNA-binding MarR family transcriptional regulator [Paenibacillus eucommiae]
MNKQEPLQLDSQLCFSLYACSRSISRMYRPLLDGIGLTYPQYLVMMVLWEKKESTVKELCEVLDLDSGTLTPMLKRMEVAGLLQRQRSKEDERIVKVQITEAGAALQVKAACIPEALLSASGLKAEDAVQLNQQIRSLLQQVNRINVSSEEEINYAKSGATSA